MIVDTKQAIQYYLDGHKVRRHITPTEVYEYNKDRNMQGFRPSKFDPDNSWVWNNGKGKEQMPDRGNVEYKSPIEVLERSGNNKNKLWEVKL